MPRGSLTSPTAGFRDRHIHLAGEPTPELPSRARLRGRIRDLDISFVLASGTYQLGSSESCDLVIAESGVSRRHAFLKRSGQRLEIEDLDSRNGTYVNGRAIDRADLQAGDRLRLGPVELQVEEVDAADAELGLVLGTSAPGLAEERRRIEQSTLELSASPGGSGEPSPPERLSFPPGYLPGCAPSMMKLYDEMRPLLAAELPVVIEGETGVGKEGIARALHLSSPRRKGPFVPVNCAAIPADLLEAEMFGIGDGVATGVKKRLGKFRQAQGGTLFLDELGEMSLPLQAKLLRALQEGEVEPLGERSIPVDVRVVAATNLDLARRLDEGRFRQDLFYRVAGSMLTVPPLRHRQEDIRPLLECFLRDTASSLDKMIRGVTVKALRTLTAYAWPGNIRELEHESRRLAHLCAAGQVIDSTMLSTRISASVHTPPPGPSATPSPTGAPGELRPASFRLEDHVRVAERRAIERALARCAGSQRQAAKLLDISRNTLARKIAQLGIESSSRPGEAGSAESHPAETRPEFESRPEDPSMGAHAAEH